jgi:predicted transcriptional regulator
MAVHLTPDLERRLDAFAATVGQRRDDVAVTAIKEYLRRRGRESELARHAWTVASMESASPETQADLKALNAQAWRTIADLD